MGWDVTYHPISEKEIKEWYFDALNDENKAIQLGKIWGIDEFYVEKYQQTLSAGQNITADDIFDKTHGFYIAVVQGFFREYFYTRGSAFSFLIEEDINFQKYTKSWQDIVPNKIQQEAHSRIIENYCSGVFIPHAQVINLLEGYHSDIKIKHKLDDFFSHERINVFLQALELCKKEGLGLLEATEVIIPQPLNIEETTCYSDLNKCDFSGMILYVQAAMEQIEEFQKNNQV